MKNTCWNNCKNGRDCFYLYYDRCKYYHSDYHKKYAKNKKIMKMIKKNNKSKTKQNKKKKILMIKQKGINN